MPEGYSGVVPMKQKLLLLSLVLGLVSVACQQNVSAQVAANEVVIVAEMPQAIVQPVEVVSTQYKSLSKSDVPKVGSKAGSIQKVVEETAVMVPEITEKAIIPTDDDTVIHTVQEGEWVFEIARCYGTTAQAIIYANFYYYHHDYYYYYDNQYYPYYYMGNANYIYPGQKLVIPDVGSNGNAYGPPCVRKHPDTVQHENGEPGTYIHTVEQGDWIYELARCYGTEAKHIMRANGLYNPNYIKPDQLLVIPLAGSTGDVDGPDCIDLYTVADGDTWASIAAAHNTTEAILKRANPGPLKVGSRIWVPVH